MVAGVALTKKHVIFNAEKVEKNHETRATKTKNLRELQKNLRELQKKLARNFSFDIFVDWAKSCDFLRINTQITERGISLNRFQTTALLPLHAHWNSWLLLQVALPFLSYCKNHVP